MNTRRRRYRGNPPSEADVIVFMLLTAVAIFSVMYVYSLYGIK